MSKKVLVVLTVLIFTAMLATACGGSAPAPSEVTFDISIIEIKGATDGIDPPSDNPEGLSTGYRFKPPGEYDESNPDKWQVSTYLFSPSAITAVLGDTVSLRMFVVNGDTHVTWLEAPDGSKVDEVTMNRGREYNLTFTADQAGYYTMHCDNHAPTMSAQILVAQ